MARLPPLNPLRAFEAAARHGSLAAAARELSVTHGAISHQIRALEENLGVTLFVRQGRRLRLSAQGAMLLPTVSNAFDSIAAATAEMRRPATAGDLAIACVPALLSFWLLPKIRDFTEQFPDVRLTLIPSNEADDLRKGDVDVHVLYGDGNWPEFWVRPWRDLALFPVMSPSLANTAPLRSIRDLRHHVLLHADDGREWHAWLSAADAPDLRNTVRHHFMSNARLAIEAAILGYGVALGDTITSQGMLGSGDLVMPFDRAVPAIDGFHVACRPEMRSAPIVGVFVDWLFSTLPPIRPGA